MTDATGTFIPINGHSLYVETHGLPDCPAVVLLHHGLGSTYSWEAQVPALVRAGYYVITYDRWGYGRSQERVGIDIPFFNEDQQNLEGLLSALGIQQTALLGHSDGGTIALYYAARHPEQVKALVVVSAHIYVEEKMQTGIEAVRTSYQQRDRFRDGLERLHGENSERVFWNWYDGWTSRRENLQWDIRPVLHRIECPALVVQGSQDEHATVQHAKDLAAAIPGAELWLLHGAPHMLPQEQSLLFNTRVVSFLKQYL